MRTLYVPRIPFSDTPLSETQCMLVTTEKNQHHLHSQEIFQSLISIHSIFTKRSDMEPDVNTLQISNVLIQYTSEFWVNTRMWGDYVA